MANVGYGYFIVVQGCPIYADIGAYIQVCIEDAYKGKRHATLNSAYRGADAESILNRHGKHSQAQLYQMFLDGTGAPANPPGFSTHELKSDGVAYPNIQRGDKLEWFMQGFDVNDVDVQAVILAAKRFGWELWQPYDTPSEKHHLNFRFHPKRPPLDSELWARFQRIRATYPRS